MFELTMTIWLLVHGVGDPVEAQSLKNKNTFSTRAECEAKGIEDQTMVAQMAIAALAKAEVDHTLAKIVPSCKAAGQEI